ncbi:hypothetical protein L2E82_32154 [Cichorium intybus]|uniref:Uncharacterized protein n=1 Tax=Cichorium intybus TaxID=13427 RepID=A0ACB9BGT5_CICIN|nr:hypothetical protein L2E82_32154 [Cichorium intybus]
MEMEKVVGTAEMEMEKICRIRRLMQTGAKIGDPGLHLAGGEPMREVDLEAWQIEGEAWQIEGEAWWDLGECCARLLFVGFVYN